MTDPDLEIFGSDARRVHWHSLSADEKTQAIHRLAQSGMSDHSIAAASGLSVQMVRQVLGAASSSGRCT